MLLSCSRLPKGKDAVDDGLDLFHSHEAHELAEFFPAAEGRAVNFQVLGNNRRSVIIGLRACATRCNNEVGADFFGDLQATLIPMIRSVSPGFS